MLAVQNIAWWSGASPAMPLTHRVQYTVQYTVQGQPINSAALVYG